MEENKTKNSVTACIILLSIALAMRQMSMSIVAPFISTYCKNLLGYTPLLAGLALGIFGLTQAIFQIPYGMLSDRYGNKPIVLIGLMQTAAGLVIAYFAKSVGLLIFARALQGSGAVIGVGYSWTAEMVGENLRTKAIGFLSAFVSLGAAAAFILGPVLRGFMEVNQMFLVGAVTIAIVVLCILFFTTDTKKGGTNIDLNFSNIKVFFHNKKLVKLGTLAFLNNFMMMSTFYAAPIYLAKVLGERRLWIVFVPAIPIACLAMKTAVTFSDKGYGGIIIKLAFLLSSISILFYMNKSSLVFLTIGTILFFCGYISLAAVIAAGINTISGNERRGMVNGIFNSMQFFGNFAGPAVTGLIWGISEKAALAVIVCVGAMGTAISCKCDLSQ